MNIFGKLSLAMLPLVMAAATSTADTRVKWVRYAGPLTMQQPVVLDSIDNKQVKFTTDNLVNSTVAMSITDNKPIVDVNSLALDTAKFHVLGFDVDATKYLKGIKLDVKGTKKYKVYADGYEKTGSFDLQPGFHTIRLKFVADSMGIDISIPNDNIKILEDGKHRFTMRDVLATRVVAGASLSKSGRWALISYRWIDAINKTQAVTQLVDLKTGQKREISEQATWMPNSDRYYYTEKEGGKLQLKTVEPSTGKVTTIVGEMPDDYFYISPTEDFAILMKSQNGPAKEQGVYEIVHPDDRQPGWRNRYSLARFDFATGQIVPLTYTYKPVYVSDITSDGRHMLFSVASDSLEQRPTTRQTYYDLNLQTMDCRMLVEKDGFIGKAMYMGNEGKVLFKASPESFGGIGNRVPKGKTPSMYDYYLYLMDTATKKIIPITADLRMSIESIDYSYADKCAYFTAQNGDSVSLYRLDAKTLQPVMIKQPMEVLSGLSIAREGGNILVYGCSNCVPYEAWNIVTPAKTPKCALVLAPNKEMFENIKLGTVKPWSFMTSRGYAVTGFYNLPADFDPAKKYPVIVNYYGGCSPTSRRFGNGTHYPAHYWNALGYIVFSVNPSGASGFGQEWASRHVNTMGEGVAQDIIDATRQFVKDVPQCDEEHIGCVSASYGGFMTQYMMTKDNPFACGVSHAGISDHTSYWGEGYWGYSYSETSAANSYPWTRKDLFVDRSPLFNADKIKKPILFTHGTADTNVPVGESIQMYTALRLLGVPTAFIEVEGENHGIMDPAKRTVWINSILAWFQKYLKGDDSWWNAIYSPKKL